MSKNVAHNWKPKSRNFPPTVHHQSTSSHHFHPIKKAIRVKEVGNEWLSRSAVAKLSPHRSMALVTDYLRSLGYVNIDVKPFGGNFVVLTFASISDCDSVFNGGELARIKEWFVEILKYEEFKGQPCSRLVWLNCYGVPLHLWNTGTFINLGSSWGEVIQVAEDTVKGLNFTVGKVLISTNSMDVINHVVDVECKGLLSPIRVIEEQIVLNTTILVQIVPAKDVKLSTLLTAQW